LDRIKPSFNVQLQTGFRKTTALPKRRHYSPDTRVEQTVTVSNPDRRRYSMAGNLNIYRPRTRQHTDDYSFGRPDPISDSELKSALVAFDSGRHKNGPVVPSYSSWRSYDSGRGNDFADEYQLRKQAESRVRGRSIGPVVTTSYSPITSYVSATPRPRPISTPPVYYRTTVRPLPTIRRGAEVSTTGRKLSDSQYELDEFERLLRKTFGHGGVNRNSTLLYASPPVPRTYSYGSLPTTGSYSYASPLYGGSYASPSYGSSYGSPSYSGSYPYVPASRYSSYYSGPTYYSANVSTYPTYSYPSYSYVEQVCLDIIRFKKFHPINFRIKAFRKIHYKFCI